MQQQLNDNSISSNGLICLIYQFVQHLTRNRMSHPALNLVKNYGLFLEKTQ